MYAPLCDFLCITLPCPNFQVFSPVFSFRSFIVLGFIFRSMIHFDSVFVFGAIYGSKLIFPHRHLIIPAPFVENTIHSLWNYISILIKNQLPKYAWFYFYKVSPLYTNEFRSESTFISPVCS